ncbi:MAG TPA: DUF2059 domain-containing protein [Allosphingosinicella sp.]|jgi:hypothetical protein
MKYLILATAALAAAPVAAQEAGTSTAPVIAAAPAADAAPADPQRLPLARIVAEQTFPAGTFRRIMAVSAEQMTTSMMGGVLDMQMKDIPAADENEADPAQANKTMREVMAEHDPHFIERMEITNRVMMTEMVPVMTKFEPQMREALALAYARRFSVEQLTDLRTFFASPSGKAYASEVMTIGSDPEFLKGMGAFVPELMKEMPAITAKLAAATAHLPPPPEAQAAKRPKKRR